MIEGWAFPPRAQRAHYFVGRASLCGKYNFFRRTSMNAAYMDKSCCGECAKRKAAREIARERERQWREANA